MRLSVLLLVICSFHLLAGRSYSQEARLSLDLQQVTVNQVLAEIERQSEFYFLYNNKLIDVNRRVNIYADNRPIKDVLEDLFNKQNVDYVVLDRQIVLSPGEYLTQVKSKLQPTIVTGTVTDENGIPLPGLSVYVKGTTKGTVTDLQGKYIIEIDDPATTVLEFSYIGYLKREVAVENQTMIDITMMPELIDLEEVVVIGYGTQKKVNLTGAVAMTTSERLEKRPIASVGLGLQGVIPNLNITIPNGDPTTSAEYNIRGFESINGGDPLILVDGVPMDLDQINPEDIQSVSILKDAGAAAIYGARAAFGVILVETKKGKQGKVKVTLTTEQSLSKPIFTIDVVTDPTVYVNAWNDAYYRRYGQNYYDETYLEGTKRWVENPTEENAWEVVNGVLQYYGFNDYNNKLITKFAPQSKYNFGINGASKNVSYYVSLGYLNKDGYLRMSDKNQKFKRYNILMKADFQMKDWLSLDEKITINNRISDQPHYYHGDVNVNTVARVSQIMPIQFPDLDYYVEPGDHDEYAKYVGMYFEGMNWFPYLEDGGRDSFTSSDIWLTQGITITPVKGLKLRSDFSYNTFYKNTEEVESKIEVVTQNLLNTTMINNGYSGTDYISNTSRHNQYYVFNAYTEYSFSNETHYLKAMVGFNQEWGLYKSVGAKAYSLISPSVTDLDATSGTMETTGGRNHLALRGGFYRLNYIYKDRYLLEANGRYDGTSRFPKESRFGFFPSISLGWRISNERFMSSTRTWLDNLKLRGSYGQLGNQLVGDYYPYISALSPGTTEYVMSTGAVSYVAEGDLVSSTLTWEKVITQNIGLDFSLFNHKFDVSFDTYIRDTKDMLLTIEYPDILGADSPKENGADLRTKGWELSVKWNDKIGKNWQYGLVLGLSDNQTEITKYENPTGALSEYYIGMQIGEIWGYETVGIFQTDEEVASAADQSQIGSNWRAGDMQYADLNGDGVISPGNNTLDDPGDRTILGNSTARYSFGIYPDLSYKNWTLSIFFQGLFRDFYPSKEGHNGFYPFGERCLENFHITDSWSPENPDAYFPAPIWQDGKSLEVQSRYLQNAAYIRLKNLTLNYYLPQNWVNRIRLNKVQVYFSGMNLWEFTKMHKAMDPERNNMVQEYYLQRIYTIGAQIEF